MPSYDSAEISELIELYIQSNLEIIFPKTNYGLYQDDGLILLRNLNDQQMEKKTKTNITVFKDSKILVLVLIFKQILKRQISLTLHGTYEIVLIVHTRTLTISCFKSTHRRTIQPKSLNSYQIPSLKDRQAILLTDKFLLQ